MDKPNSFYELIHNQPFNELELVKKFKIKNYKSYIWNTLFIGSLLYSISTFSLKINFFICTTLLGLYHTLHPNPEMFEYHEHIGYISIGYWNPKNL